MFALGIIGAFVPSIVAAADSCKVQLPHLRILLFPALAPAHHYAPTYQRPGSTPNVSGTIIMASLLTRTDLSMRSNLDKETDTVDLDQLFDQYLETDLFKDYSDATTGPSSSEDLSYLFEQPSSNESELCDTSTLPNWGSHNENLAWRKAVERLETQNAASPLIDDDYSSIYPQSGGKASLSDPILCSFEELFILDDLDSRPTSQPSTPKLQISKPNRRVKSSPFSRLRHGVNKFASKRPPSSSTKAKKMQSSSYPVGFQNNNWSQSFEIETSPEPFTLPVSSHDINSPPLPIKVEQDERSNYLFVRQSQPYSFDIPSLPADPLSLPGLTFTNHQLTPLSSPAIKTESGNNLANTVQFVPPGMGGHTNAAALSALQTPPPSGRMSMYTWDNTWGADPPGKMQSENFSSSPRFPSSTKTADCWATPSGSMPLTQPSSPSTFQGTHSRSGSQNINFHTPFSSATGLGISCDTASFPTCGPLFNEPNGLPTLPFNNIPPYTTVYQAPPGIPIGHGPANPNSRSSSSSPQPRFTRRRHSSQPHHNRNASRRKSSNSSAQAIHAHNRGASTGSGFVNFTPEDSRKILTGVAPSGSSKTKARREKEAAEKRRKMSQAAVKAIIEAGGDVGILEKEGLLLMES